MKNTFFVSALSNYGAETDEANQGLIPCKKAMKRNSIIIACCIIVTLIMFLLIPRFQSRYEFYIWNITVGGISIFLAIMFFVYGLVDDIKKLFKFEAILELNSLDYLKQKIEESMNNQANWIDNKAQNLVVSFFNDELSLNDSDKKDLLNWLTEKWPEYVPK